uniref:Putative secreted protein n=1 Tax=Anopheles darlingi TaxID=43151 RepID=A0A2M4D1B0_ANODA
MTKDVLMFLVSILLLRSSMFPFKIISPLLSILISRMFWRLSSSLSKGTLVFRNFNQRKLPVGNASAHFHLIQG